LRVGAELFDAGRFFEAHEAFEAHWRNCPRGTNASNLLQGLVQCAAAALKLQRGELRGARSLADKGTRLVESAASEFESHAGLPGLERFAPCMRAVFERDMPSMDALPRLLGDGGLDTGSGSD